MFELIKMNYRTSQAYLRIVDATRFELLKLTIEEQKDLLENILDETQHALKVHQVNKL